MNLIAGPLAEPHRAQTIGIRPEHMRLAQNGGEGWAGTVQVAEHLGSDTFLYVDVPSAGLVTVRAEGEHKFSPGDAVRLQPDPARIHRFDAGGLAMN
jgi:multiple sugar transport system ATP-binding protein